MASDASRPSCRFHVVAVGLERRRLRARPEEIGLATVALPADEGDGLDARRRRAVVAMAVVAGRCAEILAIEQEFGVNAAAPPGVLVDGHRAAIRQSIARHSRRVGVAAGAGVRDALRVHRGLRIARGQDAVRAVAVGAGRHLRVAGSQPLAVTARPVLPLLVHARVGPEALHGRRIRVAAPAEGRNRRPLRCTDEGGCREVLVHRGHVLGERGIGVAAVAVVTGKAGGGVRALALVLDDGGGALPGDLGPRMTDGTGGGPLLGLDGSPHGDQGEDGERRPPHLPPPGSRRSIANPKSHTRPAPPSTA
jgi:hypothetical protein